MSVKPSQNSNYSKYTLFPIRYKNIFQLYKTAEACFWMAEDIDITSDLRDWHTKLSSNERDYIKYILAFFAASDGIVIENVAKRFFNEIENSEGINFYAFQLAMEAIHSELYSLLIDVYINDPKEKNQLFNAIDELPVIKDKADWARRWTYSEDTPLSQRIFAFAIVEGVFFSGAFCSIYWLKDRGVMPGLSLSNDFISRDEGLHMLHACEQYRIRKDKLPLKTINNMIKDAVEVEERFIREALKFKLKGMNAELMIQYVKFVADRLLTLIDCPKLYNAENPFDFMEKISLNIKENFFEQRNGQYQRSGILSNDAIKKIHEHYYKCEEEAKLGTDKPALELLTEFAKDNNIAEEDVKRWLSERKHNFEESDSRFRKLDLSDDY